MWKERERKERDLGSRHIFNLIHIDAKIMPPISPSIVPCCSSEKLLLFDLVSFTHSCQLLIY